MEFKVGDKLRYIENRPEWYTEGAVYEVTGIDEGEDGIWIVINDNEGLYRGWQPALVAKYFERIDKPQVDRNESQPQVTKVKLTQEQAEAIKRLIEMGWDVEEIINEHHVPRAKELEVLNNLSTADVARALLIGYEVEQTAEEKVFKRWEKSVTSFNTAVFKEGLGVTAAFEHGYQNGMKSVLKGKGNEVYDGSILDVTYYKQQLRNTVHYDAERGLYVTRNERGDETYSLCILASCGWVFEVVGHVLEKG